jgi:hypothetical protein
LKRQARLLQALHVPCKQRQFATFAKKSLRASEADATAAAGDQHMLAVELQIHARQIT